MSETNPAPAGGASAQAKTIAMAAIGGVIAIGLAAAFFSRSHVSGADQITAQADALAATIRDRAQGPGTRPEALAQQAAPAIAAEPVRPAPPPTKEQAGVNIMRAVHQGVAIAEADIKALCEFRICFRDRLDGFDYTCVDLRGDKPVVEEGVGGQAGFEPNTVYTLSRSEGYPKLYSANLVARGIVLSARSLSDDYAAQDALRKPAPSPEVRALIEREIRK